MFRTIDSETKTGTCPYCNSDDSFLFKEGDRWMFLCHDCQRYKPYEIKESTGINVNINFNNLISFFTPLNELAETHKARVYANKRKIPLNRVFYTNKFATLSEKYAETPVKNDERICFLIYNEDNNLVGVTGRSLDPKTNLRYVTLMFDKNDSKIYGREYADLTKEFFACEGPIDSLFLENAIAMNGAEILNNKYTTLSTICFDNEPRNKQIVSKMKKSLEAGFKVVVWPKSIKQKDINDMILEGLDVNHIIKTNTYSGLVGLLKLNEWKK
jgi:hypothetical protein